MNFLLDTNTCIQYLNGRSEEILNKLCSIKPEKIFLCSIVKSELMFGALKSQKSSQNIAKLHLFFNQFYSYAFDDSYIKVYAEVRSHLEAHGRPIGGNDLLIASIALTNNLILVTHNLSEFQRIPNLQLEDWEAKFFK